MLSAHTSLVVRHGWLLILAAGVVCFLGSLAIVERLNKEINAGLGDPKLKARLAEMGAWPVPGSPADAAKLIADEIDKWAKVIKAGNLKAE